MTTRRGFFALRVATFTTFSCRTLIAVFFLTWSSQLALAQQTLGALNGTVTDSSGAVVQGVSVRAHAAATNLEVTGTSRGDGSFSIPDLPIGTYAVTFTREGYQTAVYPQIIVQGSRTAKIGRAHV